MDRISNNFNVISNTSIAMICSMLTRDGIEHFKCCSRRIAQICLEEMTKISVDVCKAHNLLNSKHTHEFHWINHTSLERYANHTNYSVLVEDFEIPIVIDQYANYRETARFDTIYPKSYLIIFDKKDITIINSQNITKMKENDAFNPLEYSVLVLFYFNVQKQEMSIVKYLMVSNCITITTLQDYIENILIMDANQMGKFDELKQLLNIIPCNKRKLIIYSMRDMEFDSRRNDWRDSTRNLCEDDKIIPLIFQFGTDDDISCTLKTSKLKYEVSTLKQFGFKGYDYFKHNKNRSRRGGQKTVVLKRQSEFRDIVLKQLQSQISHYLQLQKQSNINIRQIIENIDTEYSIFLDAALSFNDDILRHYLSENAFKKLIPANNIEIYHETVRSWNDRASLFVFNDGSTMCKSFDLVPYDTMPTHREYKTIYIIDVFCESQAPFPFNQTKVVEDPVARVKIKIEENCTPDEIVKELVKISSNPLFSSLFERLQDSFKSYINAKHPNCYVLVEEYCEFENGHEQYEFYDDGYLNEDDEYDMYKILYESTKEIDPTNYKEEKVEYLDLFMIPMYQMDNSDENMVSKQHRIMIRFSLQETFERKDWRKGLIGFPLFVWFDANERLQNMLDNHPILQQFKEDVCSVYNVCNRNAELISEEQRNTCKLFSDLLCKDRYRYRNGFIIITLNLKSGVFVNQHGLKGWEIVIR